MRDTPPRKSLVVPWYFCNFEGSQWISGPQKIERHRFQYMQLMHHFCGFSCQKKQISRMHTDNLSTFSHPCGRFMHQMEVDKGHIAS